MAESTIPDERVLDVLRASAAFGSLDEAVLQDLRRLLVLQVVPGGHIVYREGDQANTMFFLISGRLRVSRRGPDGELQLYNEIRPGESVGEAGLILRQPRAADITALRDSTVALLSRSDFEGLLVLHPLPLNQVFARAIYNLMRRASQVLERCDARNFVVVPMHEGADAHAVSVSLTQAFAKIGRVLHVTLQLELAPDWFVTQVWQGRDRYNELEEQYDFPIMGYGRAAQIAEAGYRYAMQEIATWKTAEQEAG